MMHFHEDEEDDFQGKSQKQLRDTYRMAFYAFLAFAVMILFAYVSSLLQSS